MTNTWSISVTFTKHNVHAEEVDRILGQIRSMAKKSGMKVSRRGLDLMGMPQERRKRIPSVHNRRRVKPYTPGAVKVRNDD
jgi:hypothetical protein